MISLAHISDKSVTILGFRFLTKDTLAYRLEKVSLPHELQHKYVFFFISGLYKLVIKPVENIETILNKKIKCFAGLSIVCLILFCAYCLDGQVGVFPPCFQFCLFSLSVFILFTQCSWRFLLRHSSMLRLVLRLRSPVSLLLLASCCILVPFVIFALYLW